MIKQYYWKKRKILSGLIRTHTSDVDRQYEPRSWFNRFYRTGVSDSQTISPDKNVILSQYHYASVELIITRHLFNNNISLQSSSVFDIGSGAGHWLNFYKTLGAAKCTGIDVATNSVNHLRERFRDDPSIQIHEGLFQDFLQSSSEKFDLINGIGVIFHVVDDNEWKRGLEAIATSLQTGGHLIVGGHFGSLNKVNVQFDEENTVNKRLRSKRYWRNNLLSLGFKNCIFYSNNAYLFVNEPIPENNILIATR